MINLIADSGATKTEWRLQTDSTSQTIFTEGLNPYYHSTQSISEVIQGFVLTELEEKSVDQIHFYGAGCDTEARNEMVKAALVPHFPDAEISIYHDLLGAARACFQDQEGIACILGTGSNSCLYDGHQVVEHIPSLAFILGDEGSAGYFGKKLINSYFRYELPNELKEDLENSYNVELDHVMHELYKDGAQKSRFIASYGAFLGKHSNHPFIKAMLREGFENFISRIIKKYTDATSHEVRFIGSVAFAHKELIINILEENGLKAGMFIKKPIERIVEYHTIMQPHNS